MTKNKTTAHNKVLPKAGVTCFYDTFVLNQTLVFQVNSSAEIPRLRKATNRYAQLFSPTIIPRLAERQL